MASETASDPAKALGNRLREAMKGRRVSQRQLAAMVGVSKQSVTNWTQGRHEPALPQLRKLAQALRVPIAYLVGEDVRDRSTAHAAEEAMKDLAALELKDPVRALSAAAPNLLELLARAEAAAEVKRRDN